MRDSLLWVYEGQTECWGRVLAARSGLRTRQETLDKLALDAAVVDTRVGRAWKTLQDTSNDPLYMAGHPVAWRDWQRREDYYPEGVILWLGVDAKMRELVMLGAVRDSAVHPIAMTFEAGGPMQDVTLNYRGPLRYPRLERITGTPDRLAELLAPLPAH